MDKRAARLRRALRARSKIRALGVHRLCVHRTPQHMYAQLIGPGGGEVITCASTLEPEVKKALDSTGNVAAAARIGGLIAERAKDKGVSRVAFDRSGFRYHGRVKALAEAAREGGLNF